MAVMRAFDFFIQWHITEKCNLKCSHCYQTGTRAHEMSRAEINTALKKIRDTLTAWKDIYDIDFSLSFNITGGEPFMREDLSYILEDISASGSDIYILTNGTLIDRKKAKALAKAGIKGVQVSMEGPEAIHDSIRGRGSYCSSVKGVKNLLNAGLRVSLNTTLSSLNAGYFTDIIKLSSDLGVQELGFSRLVPSGKGETMISKMLGREETSALYKKIFSMDTGDLEIVTGDPVASQIRDSACRGYGDIASGGCAAGVSGLTILPDGTILPCRRLHIPVGNIMTDSLREVWAGSEVLDALRDRARYKGRCGACPKWTTCRGCRAIAYAYSLARGNSDFLADDPQCFMEQDTFKISERTEAQEYAKMEDRP